MEVTTTDERGNTSRLGCGVLTFLIGLFCILWYPSISKPSVEFKDDASTWDRAAREGIKSALSDIARSLEVHFVVVTKAKIDPLILPAEADLATEQINAQQSWIGRQLAPRSGHSITFFFTETPRLLQVRWGRYTRHLARRVGLDYGAKYGELQRIALPPKGPPDLIAAATRIQDEITKARGSWIGNTAYKVTALVDDEIIPTIAVPKMDWWQVIASFVAVRLYNALTHLAPNFWLFSALMTLLLILPPAVLQGVYMKRGTPTATPEGVKMVMTGLPACLGTLVYFLVFLITIFPMFGFFIVSAGERREDILMAQALGLQSTLSVPRDVPWYILTLLILIVWIANGTEHAIALARDENIPGALLGILKLLVIVPIAYLMLPAWAVVIYTFLCGYYTLISLVTVAWVQRTR